MKLLKTLTLTTLLGIVLIGCGKDIGINVNLPQQPGNTVDAPVATANRIDAEETGNTITLDVFSKTRSGYAVGQIVAGMYTATGYCVRYNGDVYCWDDGIKSVKPQSTVLSMTYFQLGYDANGHFSLGNTFATDALAQPTKIVQGSQIGGNISMSAVNGILAATPSQVTCTESDTTVDCGNFVIDLDQVLQ